MSKVKIFTGIMVLFLLGAATGSLMTNIYFKTDFGLLGKGNSIDKRDFLIKRLSQKLELTQSQKGEIGKIMDESVEKIFDLREKNRPEIMEIFKTRITLIREKLDSEQKKKFDDLVVELRTRRQHWEKKMRNRVGEK
tara:strand:+ start:936 stop:1346 length:411 start_codon:yes stop_codon:yes gene_type:complete